MSRGRKCPCKVGDKVTCREPVEAYYSGYAGNPECHFKPGAVGTVSVIDSPGVRTNNVYAIVDFEGPAYGPDHARYTTWRVALLYRNVKVVK